MHFTLVLWIFLLVNTAQAVSLRKGQVILVPIRPHQTPRHLAIILDIIPSRKALTILQTATIWTKMPFYIPSNRRVKFDMIFTEKVVFPQLERGYGIPGGEIDIKFSYPNPWAISLLGDAMLDLKKVGELKEKMNDFRDEQIKTLEIGHLIWIMYGEVKKKNPFRLAILLGRTLSQDGRSLSVKTVQLSIPDSRTIPSECRANLKDYFTDTSIPNRGRKDDPLRIHSEIDLRFYDVGPERISLMDVDMRLKPEEVKNLEEKMEKVRSECDKIDINVEQFSTQNQGISGLPSVDYRPSQEQLDFLLEYELIWVLSNVVYQKQLSAPYHWESAIYLGPGQSQDGSMGLRAILFSRKLPYYLLPGYWGKFEEFFPGTMLTNQRGQRIPFQGTIDFRVREIPLRFIVINPDTDKVQFDAEQVGNLLKALKRTWEPYRQLRGEQKNLKERRSVGNATDMNLP